MCLPGQLQLGMYVLNSGFKLGELQPVQQWWCAFYYTEGQRIFAEVQNHSG